MTWPGERAYHISLVAFIFTLQLCVFLFPPLVDLTMGLLEMFTDTSMIIPAIVAVGTVALTVLGIFWFGFGKTRTFEEAKALASKQADLVLREEYRNSPRAKKGRRQFPRKKKTEQWEEPQQEESMLEPPKGILKSAVEPTPDKSPRSNRVEFNITMEKARGGSARPDPPTPHPHKAVPLAFKSLEVGVCII